MCHRVSLRSMRRLNPRHVGTSVTTRRWDHCTAFPRQRGPHFRRSDSSEKICDASARGSASSIFESAVALSARKHPSTLACSARALSRHNESERERPSGTRVTAGTNCHSDGPCERLLSRGRPIAVTFPYF